MPRAALLLALTLLLPTALADDAADAAPAFVAALDADGAQALVAWAPGELPADAYRVYGVSAGGAFTLLAEAPALVADGHAALVEGGYATYAVTGVVGGRESPPTVAAGCVTYEDFPWGISVGTWCLDPVIKRVEDVIRP